MAVQWQATAFWLERTAEIISGMFGMADVRDFNLMSLGDI